VLKGLPSEHVHADCMGEYVKQQSMLSGRSLYVGKAIWFCEDKWCVGSKENIGTTVCFICVDDSARPRWSACTTTACAAVRAARCE
jgi:hypothetical protein